jgi:protein phosphatase
VPSFNRSDVSFCGVFDGTVGSDASDFVQKNILNILCQSKELRNEETGFFAASAEGTESVDSYSDKIRSALHSAFVETDAALLAMCQERRLHYTSSTGVVALWCRNLLTIAHVGDSKACIARVTDGHIQPEWLTIDHKPDLPNELQRIQQCGGSLAWLHGNKPYIRGGDFFRRQAAGDHPKQLNYSRAFGGKDLKVYGLSAVPDISHFEVTQDDKLVILGSDGLWDVLNPRLACEIALRAREEGRSAALDLVKCAKEEMPLCGVRDNVSCIVAFLNQNARDVNGNRNNPNLSNGRYNGHNGSKINSNTGMDVGP